MVRGVYVISVSVDSEAGMLTEIHEAIKMIGTNKGVSHRQVLGVIVRCFVANREWTVQLRTELLGGDPKIDIPAVFVYRSEGANISGVLEQVQAMCLPLENSGLIIDAARMVNGDELTIRDVIGCFTQISGPLHNTFVGSCEELLSFRRRPTNGSGKKKRGDADMWSYGVRACANLETSGGDVSPYRSGEKCEVAKYEEALVVKQLTSSLVSTALEVYPNVIHQHGPYPGRNLSCISLGGTCFSGAHVTANAGIKRHFDPYDVVGTLIGWCESGCVLGGGFVLLGCLLTIKLRDYSIMHLNSSTWEHGSVAPVSKNGGIRYGVALANHSRTLTRARNQCEDENSELPFGYDQLYVL